MRGEMKNILYCNLQQILDMRLHLPYTYGLLKTYAEQDQEIVDNYNWLRPIVGGYGTEELIANYNIKDIDILGLSCYIWNAKYVYNLINLVKSINPNCLVVIGGPQPDYSDNNYFKKYPNVDIVVKHEGELSFYKILKKFIHTNNLNDFKDITGLLIQDGIEENCFDTGFTELVTDFNLSPYIEQKEYYESLFNSSKSILIYWESFRGCPNSCSYCVWGDRKNNLMRNQVHQIPLDRLKKEIDWFNKFDK